MAVAVVGNDGEVESGIGNIATGWDSSAATVDSTGPALEMDEGAGATGAVATELDAGRVSGFSRSIHWNTGITMASAIAAAIANQYGRRLRRASGWGCGNRRAIEVHASAGGASMGKAAKASPQPRGVS